MKTPEQGNVSSVIERTREPAPDATLVEDCKRGDVNAFSTLVTRYQDRIFNVIYRMLGNREDAADLCQETFVKAFRAIATFEARAQFSTWLYRIATNTCISFRRSHAGKVKQEYTVDCDIEALGEQSHGRNDAAADPDRYAMQRERIEAVQKAILHLDEEARAIVVLRDIDGKSYEEIAEVLNCPIGTVRSRLHRARMDLKDILQRWL
jgi:RNA polymerase sigma-70 factor (ECF subfamily)